MPSFPTFSKRRKMRNDDEGSDGLWGINFGCIAVGPKLGWGHFSSAPNAAPALFWFFGVETPSIVICSSRWLVDWRSSSNPVINRFSILWISRTTQQQQNFWLFFVDKKVHICGKMIWANGSLSSAHCERWGEVRGLGALTTRHLLACWEGIGKKTRQGGKKARQLDKEGNGKKTQLGGKKIWSKKRCDIRQPSKRTNKAKTASPGELFWLYMLELTGCILLEFGVQM